MPQYPLQTLAVLLLDRGCERRAGHRSEVAAGHGKGQRQHGLDDIVGKLVVHAQRGGDIPAVHHVVDEVESDRHLSGEHRTRTEFGKFELRLECSCSAERVDDVVRGIGIRANVIGFHRVDDGLDAPYLRVCAESSCRSGESAVLHRHVRQKVEERPARARGCTAQIRPFDAADDVYRLQHGDFVEGPDVMGNSSHLLTISAHIRYGNAYHGPVESSGRPDLAAMLAPLLRDMVAAEEPVLAAHGLTMWGYVVLLALDRSAMRTQAALAEAIGADKTRIIRTLDDLQDDGYIERRPDPDDRRVRLLAITDAGRRLKDEVQAEIQSGEERWLGELTAEERRVFLSVLQRLTPREWG